MSALPLAELLGRKDHDGMAHAAIRQALEVLPHDVFVAALQELVDSWPRVGEPLEPYGIQVDPRPRRHGDRRSSRVRSWGPRKRA